MSIKKNKKKKNKTLTKKNTYRLPFFSKEFLSKKQSYQILGGFAFVFTFVVVLASYSIQTVAESVPNSFKSIPQWRLERAVTEMTIGYPIAQMLPTIFSQDQLTTAYLVGIAKKESNWGKRSPKKDGEDCYNYWGYKGEGSRGKALGHGCFGSPEEAVKTVATRIDTLTQDYQLETPRQMVVWKCGYSCAGHSQASVQKWINDVAYYTDEIEMAKN